MSALPPEAAEKRTFENRRYVPNADINNAYSTIVGARVAHSQILLHTPWINFTSELVV
jgi:hypothetical protein